MSYLFNKSDTNLEFARYLSLFVKVNFSAFDSKYPDLTQILVPIEDEEVPDSFQDKNYLLLTETEEYELSQQIYYLNSDLEIWDLFSEFIDFEKKVNFRFL